MGDYKIEFEFTSNVPDPAQKQTEAAADFWRKTIKGPFNTVKHDGRLIEGLFVLVNIFEGSSGDTLARSGPDYLRPEELERGAFLPATAELEIDIVDYQKLMIEGRFSSVIRHEIGHMLGIGTIWHYKSFLKGAGTENPEFTGTQASREYGKLLGTGSTPVPVENIGGEGAANMHWRDSVFSEELMSTYLPTSHNPVSRLTLASMEDLGYDIDYSQAQSYFFPNNNRFPKIMDWKSKPADMWYPSFKRNRTQPKVMPLSALVVSDN